ncbi:MAG TPA: phosphatidate cytidylyltransferase [Sphaerochaeta sp.]|jgi:phosphatidate cytidylyltransferase|nr:phosphatidate cytidylyltransferase [Sphaerochaeta sp.]
MEKNLRDRLITVGIGIPAVLSMIFFVPHYNYILFSILAMAMGLLGSLEMSKLLFGKHTILSYLAALIPVIQYFQGVFKFNAQIPDLCFVLLILWSFSLEIKFGEKDDFKESLETSAKNCILVLYPGYFVSFILRFLALDGVTSYAVILYLVLAFGNDVFAYVWGRLFGKNNKGIFKVSPKKSVAGYVGSFFTAIALSIGYCALFKNHLPEINLAYQIFLGAAISITANIGDLIESVFKRSAGVKDSGNIFPGRGGALDSMDSLISSAPVFFIIFSMILGVA